MNKASLQPSIGIIGGAGPGLKRISHNHVAFSS